MAVIKVLIATRPGFSDSILSAALYGDAVVESMRLFYSVCL